MPENLAVFLFVAVLLAPLILALVLGQTRLFWLPAVALFVYGIILSASAKPEEHGGGPPIHWISEELFGNFVLLYGALCLLVGGLLYALARRKPRAPSG